MPTWSKEMSLETFEKQIQAWSQINEDVPEYSRYQDLVEGLKTNKEVKGLPGYVNDHILKVLEKKEDQTVVKILECLSKKYGRTRLEKMEEWLDNWLEFKEGDFDEEDDFFFAMKEIGI